MNPEHTELLQAVEAVEGKVDQVRADLEYHIGEGHALVAGRQELDILADVVLGRKYVTYDGEIERRGGMKAMVEAYENGGLAVNVPWGKIISLVTAMVTSVGASILALIESGPG